MAVSAGNARRAVALSRNPAVCRLTKCVAKLARGIGGNLYKEALRGPGIVDVMEGSGTKHVDGLDADDMAGVAPENRVHVARLRRMSPEELDELGDKECEERRLQESLAEIP